MRVVPEMSSSRMFNFITECWNPLCMRCQYACSYCWSEALKDGRLKNSPRYQKLALIKDRCYLVEKELNRHFKAEASVFVEDCGDLFGSWVPEPWIYEVLKVIERCPKAKFLLLTKNPKRMLDFKFPDNVLCGATIETTESVRAFSLAPPPMQRFQAMRELSHPHKMVCIEPIVDFNLSQFYHWLTWIPHLELVVVGYDNHNACLPEPSLKKTMKLINDLRGAGLRVVTKTLREARPCPESKEVNALA